MPNIIDTLRTTLAEKETVLETLAKEVEAFRSVISYYETHPQQDMMPYATRVLVVDAAFDILENQGGFLHYRDQLYPAIVERGINVAGQDPARNLAAYLSGDKARRFESQGEGRWGLKAWKRSHNGIAGHLPIDPVIGAIAE